MARRRPCKLELLPDVLRMMYLLLALLTVFPPAAAAVELLKAPVHLRSGSEREWLEFPETTHGPTLRHEFKSEVNAREHALIVRQRDVKSEAWTVSVNGQKLGTLLADERDMRSAFRISAGLLRAGNNTLEIAGAGARFSDDVEITAVRLVAQPLDEYLRETRVLLETEVVDEPGPVPVRITVVDAEGSLVPLSALRGSDREASRTGVIYTADGRTEIGLPAGEYEIYASRGFEYSAPSKRISLSAGDTARVSLSLRHEVRLGYVSCDPHVHTLELSGHGDASVRERVLTAAGEGLDIMVATEHNRTADYSEMVRKLGLERWVYPVRGNEVTTGLGHFNILPLPPDAVPPDARVREWAALERGLKTATGVKVIIQNHPRDLHAGYRPFDAGHHVASAGENLIGRPFFANAVEVINSGAMHSDILRPVLDWLGLLNRGYRVAAIGASDTHTVDFVPIAQARTYIDPGSNWRARPDTVFERLAAGESVVSYGLAAQLRRVPRAHGRSMSVEVEVLVPSWSLADRVTVYANGFPVSEHALEPNGVGGRKWLREIALDLPNDATLVAVATGPGVRRPFWEVRKSYQPVSKLWNPRVIGISRAVRIELGGGYRSPREYATELVSKHPVPGPELLLELGRYDPSVTVQTLSLLAEKGVTLEIPSNVAPAVRTGATAFMAEWSQRKPR